MARFSVTQVALLLAAAALAITQHGDAFPVMAELESQALRSAETVMPLAQRDLSSALRDCLARTGAQLTYPSDDGYSDLAKPENTNYNAHPEVLVSPSSAAQVAATIKCVAAEKGNVKVSPRGGGHGYAAYSLAGQVILDSSKMKDTTFHQSAKQVTVGFGQTLGPLAKAMGEKGFALPHGTCPQVGVAGHSLGGGWGYASRKWGWLTDHIVSMEFVDVNGNIKTLTQSSTGSDADLWWALRGAGSNNFGVVTHFTYAMEQAPSVATNYNHVYATNADCRKVLLALQDLGSKTDASSGLPAEFGGELLMYGENSGSDGACSLTGQFLGSKTDYKQTMKKLNDKLSAQGVKATKATADEFTSWLDSLTNIMGDLEQPKVFEPYYAQSLMDDGAPNYTAQSAKAITDAVQAAVGVQGSGNSISFDLNGPLSATNAKAKTGDMAFNHRKSLFFSQIYSYAFPGFNKANARKDALNKISAITNASRNAKSNGDWHAYQNYIDPELSNFGTAYYGENLDRLKSIKKTADPNTVFDFAQGLAHA